MSTEPTLWKCSSPSRGVLLTWVLISRIQIGQYEDLLACVSGLMSWRRVVIVGSDRMGWDRGCRGSWMLMYGLGLGWQG